MKKTALYTALYPNALPFFDEWQASVAAQDDSEFDIWISLDQLSQLEVSKRCKQIKVTQFVSYDVDDYVRLRSLSLAEIARQYQYVILVDSDDVLLRSRVSAAKHHLDEWDMIGCRMQLMDYHAKPMDFQFPIKQPLANFDQQIANNNLFGLSNTAYRAEVLGPVAEAPSGCVLYDWWLSTLALSMQYRIGFDNEVRMMYRQHNNIAKVMPPFSLDDLVKASDLVLWHYDMLLNSGLLATEMRDRLISAKRRTGIFYRFIKQSNAETDHYLAEINKVPCQSAWWSAIANVELEAIWNRELV